MTAAFSDYANPAIRVQQSTPTPQHPQAGFAQTPMLSTNINNNGLESWNSYNNIQSQSLQTPAQNQSRGHQRASSSSSVASSVSQYQAVGPSAGYQYVARSEYLPSHSTAMADSCNMADLYFRTYSNHLPTPTHTPTQESFMNNNNYNNNYTPTSANMDQTMSAHMSMKQALMDQGDDVPDFAHSARHSVSSYDSPATPHTAQDEMDFKMPATGESLQCRLLAFYIELYLPRRFRRKTCTKVRENIYRHRCRQLLRPKRCYRATSLTIKTRTVIAAITLPQ